MSELTYFERRKIQMEYAVLLIRDLQAILGEETILKALEERTRRQIKTTPQGGEPDFSRMAENQNVRCGRRLAVRGDRRRRWRI